MENLPLIKWHAEELYKVLIEQPNDIIAARVAVDLEALILNNSRFAGIESKPPKM